MAIRLRFIQIDHLSGWARPSAEGGLVLTCGISRNPGYESVGYQYPPADEARDRADTMRLMEQLRQAGAQVTPSDESSFRIAVPVLGPVLEQLRQAYIALFHPQAYPWLVVEYADSAYYKELMACGRPLFQQRHLDGPWRYVGQLSEAMLGAVEATQLYADLRLVSGSEDTPGLPSDARPVALEFRPRTDAGDLGDILPRICEAIGSCLTVGTHPFPELAQQDFLS